jgi:multiple sugar transport system permease protein
MKIRNALTQVQASKSKSLLLTKVISYTFLSVVAIIMILPLLWLVNGSLQPAWQINADPVIWIPREWRSVKAGNSSRKLLLWEMLVDPTSKAKQDVIQIDSRRYTTIVEPAKVQGLISVPRGQIGQAVPSLLGDIAMNVRDLQTADGPLPAVALARDPEIEDNLLVLPVEGNEGAFSVYPLDLANKGKVAKVDVGGYELSVRTQDDGRQIMAIGPESELWVVGSPEIARNATVVQSSRLGNRVLIEVGQTQLPIYTLEGDTEENHYVVIAQENWWPLMEQGLLAEVAFVAKDVNLSPESEQRVFNGLIMIVRQYTPPKGGEPYDVVILTPGSSEYLAISTDYMDQLYAAPISDLIEPGSINISTLTYRVQQDYIKGEEAVPSALVGGIQDLSVIIPVDEVKNAFDVNPKSLERALKVKFHLIGYFRVLTLKLSGTPFWRFFANSGYVVLMNMIGHYLSCVLVAYGFARLRAPGKNTLFVILLGTMMVPYVIFVLPTYLIFRDLGLLGTMVPLWLRSFFGNAFLIFVLRQFFMTIPYDLDEAAILDGANRWQILWKVILPLSKPALAMVGIFTFWWYWNSFLDPLIYITTQKYYTVTLAMNSFNQQYARAAGYYDRILAGSVLTLLPMIMLFLFAQRYFIEGIQMQGLKR